MAGKVADNGQVSLAPEVVLRRSTVRAGKGENVASIARKYKVSVETVAQWNKVGTGASFKAGQQVIVFLPAGSHAKVLAKSSARSKPAPVARTQAVKKKKR